jgi:uncharacterized protein YjeT (DUF2065 family)
MDLRCRSNCPDLQQPGLRRAGLVQVAVLDPGEPALAHQLVELVLHANLADLRLSWGESVTAAAVITSLTSTVPIPG